MDRDDGTEESVTPDSSTADPTETRTADASSVVPKDAPAVCGTCGAAYDSVSEHDDGLLVNLHDNERYQRVCFEPTERGGTSVVRFYHHTRTSVVSDIDRRRRRRM